MNQNQLEVVPLINPELQDRLETIELENQRKAKECIICQETPDEKRLNNESEDIAYHRICQCNASSIICGECLDQLDQLGKSQCMTCKANLRVKKHYGFRKIDNLCDFRIVVVVIIIIKLVLENGVFLPLIYFQITTPKYELGYMLLSLLFNSVIQYLGIFLVSVLRDHQVSLRSFANKITLSLLLFGLICNIIAGVYILTASGEKKMLTYLIFGATPVNIITIIPSLIYVFGKCIRQCFINLFENLVEVKSQRIIPLETITSK